MANKNRFADLMGATGEGSEPIKPSEQVDRQTTKKASGEPTYQKKYRQSVARGKDTSVGKSADPNYDKVTVYIHSDIAYALRVIAAVERAELSQLVEDAVLKRVLQSSAGKAALEEAQNDD